MGAGTLIEIIAKGSQDAYLIGNPQMSYFKAVYKRHTNFAMEPITQLFSEIPDFGKRATCIIDKKADLLNDIILDVELPALVPNVSWVNGIGYFMIEYIELQMGGELIDKISGTLLDAWMELNTEFGIKNILYNMIGKYTTFNKNTQTGIKHLLIPLPFWFTRGVERSLPLVALQYTDIKIIVQFKPFDKCWFKLTAPEFIPPSNISITSASLICNYIYLDTFERQKVATQQITDYLIEQFQENVIYQIITNTLNIHIPIYFNHPVKELIWLYISQDTFNNNDYYNYSSIVNYNTINAVKSEPFNKCQLRFNGNERFEYLPANYFYLYQPYRYHSCGPTQYIHVYSFAITPEAMQPSGASNFSKIDNIALNMQCNNNIQSGNIHIYATNYNVLRIQNGMAGILFSS